MSAISSITSGASSAATAAASTNDNKPHDLKDLDINQFLKLMVTELTNQDPLNPMDNTQLVQQLGELRSIAASDQLTTTLQAMQTQQSLTTASGLIGKTVTALGSDGQDVTGTVRSVSVEVDEKNNNKRSYKVKI